MEFPPIGSFVIIDSEIDRIMGYEVWQVVDHPDYMPQAVKLARPVDVSERDRKTPTSIVRVDECIQVLQPGTYVDSATLGTVLIKENLPDFMVCVSSSSVGIAVDITVKNLRPVFRIKYDSKPF